MKFTGYFGYRTLKKDSQQIKWIKQIDTCHWSLVICHWCFEFRVSYFEFDFNRDIQDKQDK